MRKMMIIAWIFWGILALFVHGNPPLHYFVCLFPLPPLLGGIFLAKLWHKKRGKALVLLILFLIAFTDFRFFFSQNYFYRPNDYVSLQPWYVPFNLQKQVAEKIVNDSQGREYNLYRVGPFDYFEKNFAQNYWYLTWWLGNEPSKTKVKLSYTIYEDLKKLPKKLENGEKIFKIANIVILRKEK